MVVILGRGSVEICVYLNMDMVIMLAVNCLYVFIFHLVASSEVVKPDLFEIQNKIYGIG